MSGGLRAARAAKPLPTALEVVPIPEGAAAPDFQRSLDGGGAFRPDEPAEKSATAMPGGLLRWAEALKPLRAA